MSKGDSWGWRDVMDKLEELGVKVDDRGVYEGKREIDIQFYSPAGQDCNFFLFCDKDDPSSVVYALEGEYENYDVDRETMQWVDDFGQGKNGAPSRLRDVLEDMESVERFLDALSGSMRLFMAHSPKEYTTAEIGKRFLDAFVKEEAENPDRHILEIVGEASKTVLGDAGGLQGKKKDSLNKFFRSRGVTDGDSCEEIFEKMLYNAKRARTRRSSPSGSRSDSHNMER